MPTRMDLRRCPIPTIAATNVVVILVISLLGPSRAHAQSAEAESLFTDGNRLMTDGKLAQACDAFEASNRAEPRAGTLLRLGECREQNQQLASAWSAYKDALGRAKDPQKRNFATARITALEARLSTLTVTVPDASRIQGLTVTRNGEPFDPMLWNRALPVDGGDYVFAGHAPGHEDWQTTAHVPTEGARIAVEMPKLPELSKRPPPPAPAVASNAPPAGASHPRGDAGPSVPMVTARRKLALGVAGASVLGVVVGAVLGESAKAKQSDAYKLCANPATQCAHADQAEALIKAGQRRALDANIAFGLAGAAAIGAGVLWFTGAPVAEDPVRVSVVPSIAPGETGIVVLGRF